MRTAPVFKKIEAQSVKSAGLLKAFFYVFDRNVFIEQISVLPEAICKRNIFKGNKLAFYHFYKPPGILFNKFIIIHIKRKCKSGTVVLSSVNQWLLHYFYVFLYIYIFSDALAVV